MTSRLNDLPISVKLSAIVVGLLLVALSAMTLMVSATTERTLASTHLAYLTERTHDVVQTLDAYDQSLEGEVSRADLGVYYKGPFSIDPDEKAPAGSHALPILRAGAAVLNGETSAVDAFAALTGGTATLFVRSGDDFVRVATSVKNERGERATGTTLDRTSQAYLPVLRGQPYIGKVSLFGKDYVAKYSPINDDKGRTIGLFYVGLDAESRLKALKDEIRKTQVGKTGYFYVIDATPGPRYGHFVVHPTLEGSSALGLKDDVTGKEFIREILAERSGSTRYMFTNRGRGETQPRAKVVAFETFSSWNWVVVVSAYESEALEQSVALRNWLVVVACVVLLGLSCALVLSVHKVVRKPLVEAMRVTREIAGGNLACSVESRSGDEVGVLLASLRHMAESLSRLVNEIRSSAESITTASTEIAHGNEDLNQRTERQVAGLEETAASVEQLTSTVKRNAESAQTSDELVRRASDLASEGGRVVATFLTTMGEIRGSSKRIAGILGVIDGLAFQTNILALNAAVEAARAGEQGRGFAVIATEVGSLAQRSAAAAKEIHALIADEASRVDSGALLIEGAQAKMGEVVASVQRVTAIMADVASASKEQSLGVEQVNRAIADMDQATQQNAGLVQQAAAAAQSMQREAERLSQAVARFR